MKYFIHKKINAGGMADLFLASAHGEGDFKRPCVIKVIKPDAKDDAAFVSMFTAEAKVNASLHHRNIVSVLDVAEIEGRVAIVMELVVGSDLETLLIECDNNNGRLPIPVALYIVMEAAKGLHHAHKAVDGATGKPLNIIHRDVSPGNILISEEGEVKVSDFGIAKYENRGFETSWGIVKGKATYLSPEQIYAVPLSAASDIFSLGVVLWECLAGERRLPESTLEAAVKQLGESEGLPNLCEINPGVDSELNEIVARATARLPNERYVNIQAFAKVLDAYLRKIDPHFSQEKLRSFVKRLLKERLQSIREECRLLLSANNNGDKLQDLKFDFPSGSGADGHRLYQPGKDLSFGAELVEQQRNSHVPIPHERSLKIASAKSSSLGLVDKQRQLQSVSSSFERVQSRSHRHDNQKRTRAHQASPSKVPMVVLLLLILVLITIVFIKKGYVK